MKMITLTCEECGGVFERSMKEHTRNSKKRRNAFCNRSCSKTYTNKNEMSLSTRKKCGEHIRQYSGNRQDGLSPFRYFITKSKSKDRSHYGEPNITAEYLKTLWNQQQGKCSYTNIQMILPRNTVEYQTGKTPIRASLDRIDSNKGYVIGNVEFVCYAINMAKNSFTCNEMKEFLRLIVLSVTQS